MPKKKKTAEEEAKKTEVAVKTTKAPASIKPREKKTAVTPAAPLNVWRAFDDAFERVRSDFADILFPSYWEMPALLPETRVPAVDLEDREKDYLLKAEMPGFKKEDIEIEAQDNSLTITGTAGWFEDPNQILNSGKGICAQFSIVYISACLALNNPSRLVVAADTSNWNFIHVWAEDYFNGGWVHVDPSDSVWNNPSRYQGWDWGKGIGLDVKIYAFEDGGFEEVTSNYSPHSN